MSRTRIGIHIEPVGRALGGADFSAAVLAEALQAEHDVEIVHHRTGLTSEELAAFSGTDLGSVRARYADVPDYQAENSRLPWRRFKAAKAAGADLSAPYDAFITITHGIPPFCHAHDGIVWALFPMTVPLHRALAGKTPWAIARRLYARFEWTRRLASYDSVLAISEFTREWVQRRWGVNAAIVYPPCDTSLKPGSKEPMVLSVGRFTVGGHLKCQLEMVRAFRELGTPEWSYVLAGSLGPSAQEADFVHSIRELSPSNVTLRTNAPREEVRSLFGRAAIFWHAAGICTRANVPDLAEHFGITTVEAMTAGCVPVVVNLGAQPELVEHGKSGFLWNTLEELVRYTRLLVDDPDRRASMAAAARERAARFTPDRFVAGLASRLPQRSRATA